MFKARLIILFLKLTSHLSLATARRLGRGLGSLAWRLNGRLAQVTRSNLKLCWPELAPPAREQLGRDSLRETFATMCEGGAVWLWPAPRILDCIQRVEGLELLQAAHRAGKGVVVIGPHLGNWELLGLYLNACGLGQIIQLFQPPRDPGFADFIFIARSRSGASMAPTDSKGVGQLLSALRDGQVVGILPDQVPPESGGAFAPFFGQPALTMTLLSKLLDKTGARGIMGYAKRVRSEAGEGFEIIFREVDPRLQQNDLATSLTGLNASVEALVREAPEQYQWEYKRFKRQPEGLQRPY